MVVRMLVDVERQEGNDAANGGGKGQRRQRGEQVGTAATPAHEHTTKHGHAQRGVEAKHSWQRRHARQRAR